MSHEPKNALERPSSAFSAVNPAPSDRDHLHARELLGVLFSSSQFSRREVSIEAQPGTHAEVCRGGYF